MRTIISALAMMLSIMGAQPLFAQIAKTVSFQIVDIPTKQGRILLVTGNGKHYGMVDATDATVKINLNDIPCGKHTIYVFHDANGNYKLDMSADNIPIEYCATQEIDVTADNQIFKIGLVNVQEKKRKANHSIKN